jgi:hypothetical protein
LPKAKSGGVIKKIERSKFMKCCKDCYWSVDPFLNFKFHNMVVMGFPKGKLLCGRKYERLAKQADDMFIQRVNTDTSVRPDEICSDYEAR